MLSACDPGTSSPKGTYTLLLVVVSPFVLGYIVWHLRGRAWYQEKQKRSDALFRVRKEKDEAAALKKERRTRSVWNSNIPSPAREMSHVSVNKLQRKAHRFNFRFSELGLTLKSSGVPVLQGVSGRISSSRVTAVMGPSGAGKSTFVTTLAGKATYGNQTGHVYINGVERSLGEFKGHVGFVPQEDIMMRDCTVRENLRYSAWSRLPREWTYVQKVRHRYHTHRHLFFSLSLSLTHIHTYKSHTCHMHVTCITANYPSLDGFD
jgi:ABC-type multidrug transport system fused ATPase/permease subunit